MATDGAVRVARAAAAQVEASELGQILKEEGFVQARPKLKQRLAARWASRGEQASRAYSDSLVEGERLVGGLGEAVRDAQQSAPQLVDGLVSQVKERASEEAEKAGVSRAMGDAASSIAQAQQQLDEWSVQARRVQGEVGEATAKASVLADGLVKAAAETQQQIKAVAAKEYANRYLEMELKEFRRNSGGDDDGEFTE